MKTAIVHGCYNTTNFGDLLLLEMISKHLQSKWNLDVKSIRVDPNINLEYCSQVKSLRHIIDPDYIIFGGGGYLHDHGLKGAKKTLRYYLPAKLWANLGKEYVIIAPGGGPTAHTEKGAKRLRYLLEKSKVVALRDQVSLKFAKSIGVKREDILVTADLALTLSKEDILSKYRYNFEDLISKYDLSNKKVIGFHLELIYSDREKFTEFCNLPFFKNFEILNNFHFIFFYDYKTDNSDWVKNKLKSIDQLSFSLQERMDHWTTVDFISRLDAVFTSKLHVSIVATAFNIPIFGYSFHEKTKRFFEEIGRSQFQVMMDESLENFDKWINLLQAGDVEAWNHDKAKVDKIKNLAKRNFDIIDKYIMSK